MSFDPLALLDELVRIPSHQDERAAAAWLADRLEPLVRGRGVRVSVRDIPGGGPGRQCVTAEWGAGPRSLLLNSHLDTVPPGAEWPADPLVPRRIGGGFHALGAADAKGSLAAMTAAFEAVVTRRDPARGRLVLSAVGMEETAGRGSEAEVERGLRAEAAIVGEPTDLEVCVAHKGVLRLEVITTGRAAHASEPWEGENAIEAMAPVVSALGRLAGEIAQRTEEPVGRASLAVTTIRGGTARNVVPARCELDVDRRLLPREGPAAARAEIEAAVRAACPRGVEVREVLVAEAAATDPADAIVRLAAETVARLRGTPARTRGFGACCDMRLFRNLGGMPSIILGPGSLSQAHRADERVPESEVRLAARAYEEIAERWLDRP